MTSSQFQSQTKMSPPQGQEVAIRTMASDIRSIAQGEVTPIAEVVSPKQLVNDAAILPGQARATTTPKRGLKIMLILIGILIALGAVAYFVLPSLLSQQTSVTPL